MRRTPVLLSLALAAACTAGCATGSTGATTGRSRATSPGFVIAAGQRVPVDVPVVTFRDAGGFDARCRHRWFAPDTVAPSSPAPGCDTPQRWSERRGGPPPRTLSALRERVTQLVLHYDAAGTSERCFEVLHDVRGLSVHFLLDVDGTLYQTLDLAARARHAGAANDVSIGIEIAHPGAYATEIAADRFYAADGARLALPAALGPPRGGPFAPARPGLFRGALNGSEVVQRDFTAAQYRTLRALVRSLARTFPALAGGPPRGPDGGVRRDVLTEEERAAHRGLLGHVHVSATKVDPGPAFDWERL